MRSPTIGPFPRVSNWRAVLLQAVLGGVGSVVALTLAGWPGNAAEAAWVAEGGLVVGVLIAFGIEYVLKLHREIRRLQGIEQNAAAERKQHAEHVKLLEHQVVLAKREAAINAVHLRVYGDAHKNGPTPSA